MVMEHGYTGRFKADDRLMSFERIIGEKLLKKFGKKRGVAILVSFLIFISLTVFSETIRIGFEKKFGIGEERLTEEEAKMLIGVQKAEELKTKYGEMKPVEILHNMTTGKTVNVNGKEEGAYVYVWMPWRDPRAPEKGWLTMENPFYRIDLNLDHPYYLIFDKVSEKQILLYSQVVENPTDILSGSTLGFADLDGDNSVPFSSLAFHDSDGIGYRIITANRREGYLLVGTEGWDFMGLSPNAGYDVEGEVYLGIFADKPFFLDAT